MLQSLKVSENGHFLAREDDSLFFWLGDTGSAIWKIGPEDVNFYMSTRAKQGFTLVQVRCGYDVVNTDGQRPYLNDDTDTPNEAFWHNFDAIVKSAQDQGLYISVAPMKGWENEKAFREDAGKAFRLGQWLGQRYQDQTHVVWVVSWEYDSSNYGVPISAQEKAVHNALAQGLDEGHGGAQLMTTHPAWPITSSTDFHQETWLDFNMLQSCHEDDRESFGLPEVHTTILHDYHLIPAKPVLDGEPFYEDAPDGFYRYQDGMIHARGGAEVVRRKAYWSVFAGACGHTYGHNDVCMFFTPSYPGETALSPGGSGQRHNWKEALQAPGAGQMKHLRALLESLPFLKGIPDQSILAMEPGSGRNHLQATRGLDGSYALVYLPAGGTVLINMAKLSAPEVNARWFDPRTGNYAEIGVYPSGATWAFTAPGEPTLGNDWVLVLRGSVE